jgi:hypothetical protein
MIPPTLLSLLSSLAQLDHFHYFGMDFIERGKTMSSKNIFRISFTSAGKGYEIFAGKVVQADLYGFVQVENILFGERSSVVVDPSEEQLKNEFGNVKRLLIPFHAIHRIDEVERAGKAKIVALAGSDSALPPHLPPRMPEKK